MSELLHRARGRLVGKLDRGSKVAWSVRRWAHVEGVDGLALVVAAAAALAWANTAHDSYETFWSVPLTVELGGTALAMDLRHVVNDGLMAIFFFLAGLEIKRGLSVGALSGAKRAVIPVTTAAAGVLVPIGIFFAIVGDAGQKAWGIPMATDIAFAVGVLGLLGSRVPQALRTLLLALAVCDDLAAIGVIALFLAHDVSWLALGIATAIYVVIVALRFWRIDHWLLHGLCALGLWIAFVLSGVHATIAGVLVAFAVPVRPRRNPDRFVQDAEHSLDRLRRAIAEDDEPAADRALGELEERCYETDSPMDRAERVARPVVVFLVLPLFALANAGVSVDPAAVSEAARSPLAWAIIAGLLIGKPVGIVAAAAAAVRWTPARLPDGLTWGHITAMGFLAGIGFTMSIFIANLSLQDADLVELAKLSVFAASIVAALIGLAVLTATTRHDA